MELPRAEKSPRIVNGVLHWYQGDTFEYSIELDLEDQDGVDIPVSVSASVNVKFYDAAENLIKTFYFTNISSNTITLVFDDETSALFRKGKYTYDVEYTDVKVSTVGANLPAYVE